MLYDKTVHNILIFYAHNIYIYSAEDKEDEEGSSSPKNKEPMRLKDHVQVGMYIPHSRPS